MIVVWNGPAGQQSFDVAEHNGGNSILEPGAEYRVPAELGERLLASSSFWAEKPKPKVKEKRPDA